MKFKIPDIWHLYHSKVIKGAAPNRAKINPYVCEQPQLLNGTKIVPKTLPCPTHKV